MVSFGCWVLVLSDLVCPWVWSGEVWRRRARWAGGGFLPGTETRVTCRVEADVEACFVGCLHVPLSPIRALDLFSDKSVIQYSIHITRLYTRPISDMIFCYHSWAYKRTRPAPDMLFMSALCSVVDFLGWLFLVGSRLVQLRRRCA